VVWNRLTSMEKSTYRKGKGQHVPTSFSATVYGKGGRDSTSGLFQFPFTEKEGGRDLGERRAHSQSLPNQGEKKKKGKPPRYPNLCGQKGGKVGKGESQPTCLFYTAGSEKERRPNYIKRKPFCCPVPKRGRKRGKRYLNSPSTARPEVRQLKPFT